jgi:hypothetical protein
MKYSEWNPAIHTVKDDPAVGLTYLWNQETKGQSVSKAPRFILVGQDFYDAFVANLKNNPIRFMGGPLAHDDLRLRFKTAKLQSSGLPGWDVAFLQYDPEDFDFSQIDKDELLKMWTVKTSTGA